MAVTVALAVASIRWVPRRAFTLSKRRTTRILYLVGVTRADALGLSHHDRCDRPGDPPLGVTSDLDDLLGCWRCWYIAARRRD